MTILVGVKCTDGVVIGSDSIATSSAGPQPVMQIESNNKIHIFRDKVIVAATGAVGYTQRLLYHVEQSVTGGGFLTTKKSERPQLISKRFIADLQSSLAPSFPPHGIGFGALLATEINGEPCLVEYGSKDFQSEFKEDKLFYVSMGSGQSLADPFLAFVCRVLWKNQIPDLRLGRFGAYWALSHTISLAPGMVGGPIKIATLSKGQDGWKAAISANNDEAQEFIADVEAKIGVPFADAPAKDADVPPLPTLGAAG